MYEITIDITDTVLGSSYVVTDGTPGYPTIATAEKTIMVEGLPEYAVIQGVVLTCTVYTSSGYPQISQINSKDVEAGGWRTVDLSDLITGNGQFTLPYRYQSYAQTQAADGRYTNYLMIRSQTVIITFESGEPPVPPRPPVTTPESTHICLYEPDATDYESNGIAILHPTECIVTEEAGGDYSLSITMPLDFNDLRWQLIRVGSVIKAPVPQTTTPTVTLANASFWRVVRATKVYQRPYVSYTQSANKTTDNSSVFNWKAWSPYSAGDVCIYNGVIYKCISDRGNVNWGAPPSTSGAAGIWTPVGSITSGEKTTKTTSSTTVQTPTLASLVVGEVITNTADYNSSWMRVKTSAGVEGYVQKDDCEYYSDSASGSTIAARVIRMQCFRVYSVSISTDGRELTADALHISYDLGQTMLGACEVIGAAPASAIAILQASELTEEPDKRLMATDLTEPLVTADWSWGSALDAVLDPDEGIVAKLKAKLIRDNQDFFILNNDRTPSGYRISAGVNLIGVDWDRDMSEVITRIIPVAKDASGNPYLLADVYVDSPMIGDYPLPRAEVLEVDAQIGKKGINADGEEKTSLTEAEVIELMQVQAAKRFSEDKADHVNNTVSIEFQHLPDTEEYAEYRALANVHIYDTVLVTCPQIGLSEYLQVTGYEWDCTNPERGHYRSITLGDELRGNSWPTPGYRIKDGSLQLTKLTASARAKITGNN